MEATQNGTTSVEINLPEVNSKADESQVSTKIRVSKKRAKRKSFQNYS